MSTKSRKIWFESNQNKNNSHKSTFIDGSIAANSSSKLQAIDNFLSFDWVERERAEEKLYVDSYTHVCFAFSSFHSIHIIILFLQPFPFASVRALKLENLRTFHENERVTKCEKAEWEKESRRDVCNLREKRTHHFYGWQGNGQQLQAILYSVAFMCVCVLLLSLCSSGGPWIATIFIEIQNPNGYSILLVVVCVCGFPLSQPFLHLICSDCNLLILMHKWSVK